MANRIKLTPKKRRAFCAELAKTANVTSAAKKVGMSRQGVYDARNSDEAFSKAWDDAVDKGIDTLEEEARRRAYEGCEEPVFYKGEECGAIRRYSDTLMIFLLKAARPAKYRERYDVQHSGAVAHTVEVIDYAKAVKPKHGADG